MKFTTKPLRTLSYTRIKFLPTSFFKDKEHKGQNINLKFVPSTVVNLRFREMKKSVFLS